MDPRALLQALMDQEGLNPNSLAAKTRFKTKQPQIHRFLDGVTKEPKRSTLQPVADYFNIPVDALFDPRAAAAVAAELKVRQVTRQTHTVDGSESTQRTQKIADAVRMLGRALSHLDVLSLDQARSLLHRLADNPELADDIGERLEGIIAAPAARPRKATGT